MSDDWANGQCHAAVWPEVLEALRKAHVVGKSTVLSRVNREVEVP